MDLKKLMDRLELDEKVLTELHDAAEKNREPTSFYAGNLHYIKSLKKAIEDGLFDKDID